MEKYNKETDNSQSDDTVECWVELFVSVIYHIHIYLKKLVIIN